MNLLDVNTSVGLGNEMSDDVKVKVPPRLIVIVPGGGPVQNSPIGQQPPSSQNSLKINCLMMEKLLEKHILGTTTPSIH